MTCKNCIHYVMCLLESVRMGKYQDVETRCDQFKNKSDFQEVKHGQWIEHESVEEYFKCSVCKINWDKEDVKYSNMNYCPVCGAKMDGGNNG